MATELSLTRAKKAVKLVTVNVRIWWENVGGKGGEGRNLYLEKIKQGK